MARETIGKGLPVIRLAIEESDVIRRAVMDVLAGRAAKLSNKAVGPDP